MYGPKRTNTRASGELSRRFLGVIADVVDLVADAVEVVLPAEARPPGMVQETEQETGLAAHSVLGGFPSSAQSVTPTDDWYNTYVASLNNPDPSSGKIAQGLQACASPGLFYDVQSGGDITAALQALFDKVVRTAAHLTPFQRSANVTVLPARAAT